MTQHFVLCVCGSLKRSLCLGRYFSRYVSCLLLMAPRRFLRRQDVGRDRAGPRLGHLPGPREPEAQESGGARVGGSSRPPEPFLPPDLHLSCSHCQDHPF